MNSHAKANIVWSALDKDFKSPVFFAICWIYLRWTDKGDLICNTPWSLLISIFWAELKFFKVLEDYPQCNEILGILVKLQCKKACRGGGGSPYCDIRNCCQKNELEGCWQCKEFENCSELQSLNDRDGGAHLKNLRILAEMGEEYFLKNKRYWYSDTSCQAHV